MHTRGRRRGPQVSWASPLLIALALSLLSAPTVTPAQAVASRGKGLIVAPKRGARLPARPLEIAVRAPVGAERFRVRLNGRAIGKELRPRAAGVRRLRASPSHGLRHGRNVLTVRVRLAKGQTIRRRRRFRVRRNRPLAAAGRDRVIQVGERARLSGARSRSHLARHRTSSGGARGEALTYRWRLASFPRGGRGGIGLVQRRSAQPRFSATEPGRYRLRLVVTAADGRRGRDSVVVRTESVAPHIDAVAASLGEKNPGTEGKIWGISTGNSLPDPWLLQTPDCWGMADCGPGPLPPSAAAITDRITAVIGAAQKSVTIAGLWPPPDGGFRDAIVTGLNDAIAAGHKPTVRYLLGTPPTQFDASTFKTWFNGVTADLKADLPIEAAGVATYPSFGASTSWNHSKVITVDGRQVVVGGMNYWAGDYLQVTDPVNDVTMTADGPAAADAATFEDVLWGWVCDHRNQSGYVALRTSNLSGCLSTAETLPPRAEGSVPILTMGRLGNGIDVPGHAGEESPPIAKAPVQGSACNSFQRQVSDTNTNPEYQYRNPGETGLRALISSASSRIFISQQDLLSCVEQVEAFFDERVLAALGRQVIAGVPITIVISDKGAIANGGSYSNGYQVADLATQLQTVVAALKPNADARQMVCDGVGLAGVRTLDGVSTWPNGSPFANHAKVVWIDGEAFYIGSENLYPARLQELGMLVEDTAAAGQMETEYLDPLWSRARGGAVIDPDNDICNF